MLVNDARTASACGCFAPPDPSVPVVQAGERIVFGVDGNQVVAHIQIQYQGDAKQFGWILPLPSLPTKADGTPGIDVGSDELFAQITNTTQPKYRLNRVYSGSCGQFRNTFGATPAAAGAGGGVNQANDGSTPSPLVIQESIGPYEVAVLDGHDKTAMFNWLTDPSHNYFIPAGTQDVVGQYTHAGAYFVAVKLLSGKSAGDLQPVVVRYTSELPMIPIVLTSVAAQPNMGIQVWVLGSARAIPRNYYHTVLNDAAIDWSTSGQNYNDVIIRAVNETPQHHTFVTEFAGNASVMQGVLDTPGRFGSANELQAITDPVQFIQYLLDHNFAPRSTPTGGGPVQFSQPAFSSELLAILQNYFPEPQTLVNQNVTPAQFYGQIQNWAAQNPGLFAGLTFDPVKATADLESRIVQPTLDAAKLFTTYKYMTRLYTTLSPEDMNSDPVFSFNPDLPAVDNVHQATLTYQCGWMTGNIIDGTLQTADGFTLDYPNGNPPSTLPTMPASLRTEILRESGGPQVVTDNQGKIDTALGIGGCSVAPGARSSSGLAGLALLGAVALALGGRRSRRVRH
jgi:hypothetical protein